MGRSRSEHARPSGQRRRRRIVWWSVLGCVLVLVLVVGAAGAWLAYTGLAAKSALESAAGALSGAQSALLEGDAGAADAAVTEASELTSQAREQTSDVVWRVAGAVPWVGATPRSVTLATDAADQVVSQALPQFVAAAKTLDISTIKGPNGQVDLTRFTPASAQLASAQGSLRQADATLAQLPESGVPDFVQDGTAELQGQVDEALGVSTTAASLLGVLPGMLGATTPQTYFVAFQSPVEIRGTGGFLGTYGLLTVANGDLVRKDTFTNYSLKTFPGPVVDLGVDYTDLYGANTLGNWTSMNMSPNFPFAGVQWATGWQKQEGEQVAGVMGVDITALQYLIQATGPVTAPDGRVLTEDNVVQYLGNDIYLEFADDNEARKEYQAQVATELIDRVLSLEGGTSALVKALSQSVSGGHLQLWSVDAATQEVLETTPVAGQTSTAEGPYVELVLNNGGGNKLDYYLQRRVEYTAGECFEDGSRRATVKVTLTNVLDPGVKLPPALVGAGDANRDGQPDTVNRTLSYVHLPIGAGIGAVRIDGQPAASFFGMELGRPVAYNKLDLPPGQPVTVEYDIIEPQSDAEPVVPEQPMVRAQETVVNWKGC